MTQPETSDTEPPTQQQIVDELRELGRPTMWALVWFHRRTASISDLTAGLQRDELEAFNEALRADLVARDPQSIATTEVNGGDTITFVDDDDRPQTVATVLAEVDAFLAE